MKPMVLITTLYLFTACSAIARAENREIRLNVCFENQALLGQKSGGLRRVVQALVGALEKLGEPSVSVRTGVCGPDEKSLRGCFGVERVLACRADDIAQLMLVAELAEKLEGIAPVALEARYAQKGAIAPSDAISSLTQRSISSGAGSTKPLIEWISRETKISAPEIQKALDATLADFASQAAASEKKKFAHAANALMMDFLIGHELFHVRGNRCAVSAKSIAEENNSWNFAIDSMSNNQLFCAEPFAADEARADQCGLRSVRVGRGIAELAKLSKTHAAYASSIAADALGWALITRHEARLIERPEQNMTVPSPNYLHPVLRNAVIADELLKAATSAPARPAWCDRMAQAMTIAIQKTVASCEQGKGDVDDVLLARLPKSVVVAWQGGTWSPETFYCAVPMK